MEPRPGKIEGHMGRVILKGDQQVRAGVGEPNFARPHAGPGGGEHQSAGSGKVIGDTVHIDVIDQAGNMFTATRPGGGCSPRRSFRN